MAVDAIVRALWRTCGQPAPPARVDHRRGGAGVGVDRPADAGAQALGRAAGGAAALWACAAGDRARRIRCSPPCSASPGRCRRSGPGGSAGRGRRAAPTPCRRADRDYLEGVARDTWRLFERCVVPDDHHLPPDNLQIAPHDMVAHRTSPTNIGLYLLATACAREFGWIGRAGPARRGWRPRSPRLQTLPRHRGHFLNWYDTAARAAAAAACTSRPSTAATSAAPARRGPGLPRARSRARRRSGAAPRAGRASKARIDALLRGAAERPLPAGAARRACSTTPIRWREPRRRRPERDRGGSTTALAELRAWLPEVASSAADEPAPRLAWAIEDRLATLRSALRDRDGVERRDGPPARRRRDLPAAGRARPTSASSTTASAACSTSAFASPSSSSTPASTTCWRPSRAPTSLLGDRQGRRAGRPLGRARPAVLRRRRRSPACARGRARCSST